MDIGAFFNIILYEPIVNTLLFIYNLADWIDFGLAVVLITIIIKFILSPFSLKAVKSQKNIAALQPKIKEVQKKYKGDKEKQSKELLGLYKKEKINPLSGCFPVLIQLPILLALYRVFLKGFSPEILREHIYNFIHLPSEINMSFLGLFSVAGSNMYLALITAGAQYLQLKISQKKKSQKEAKSKDMGTAVQSQMLFILPVVAFFIVWQIGTVIGLYWLTSALFSTGEYLLINRRDNSPSKQK